MSGDDVLNGFVSELKRLHKSFLGDLISGTFDHHHFLFASNVNQIERGIVHLLVGRIDHEFSVNFSQSNASDGTVPGDVGNHQGRGGSIDHKYVRFVDLISGKEVSDDLNLIEKTFGKERTQGTIAKAGG